MFATSVRRASPCRRILASELAWRFPGAGGGVFLSRNRSSSSLVYGIGGWYLCRPERERRHHCSDHWRDQPRPEHGPWSLARF